MHSLILGMTESGKTALAKKLIKEFKAKGIHCISLDPLSDPDWGADFITNDPIEFENVWKASRACICVIDEAGTVGKFSDSIREAATKGRHWGHSFLFLSQRGTQIEPLVRDQCSALFLFRSGMQSRKVLAEEFNAPELLTDVEMLEFHHCTRSGYIGKKKITFD
jgi:DNA helicase HerA-like ATPase